MNESSSPSNIDHGSSSHILTFQLDGDDYGADIRNISEVLEYCEVTRVPRSPSNMAGVINLRGHVVPVINLRDEFELSPREPDVDTCIVIFEFNDDFHQTHLLGCIVDSVSEVMEISPEQLTEPPKIGNHIDPSFIDHIAKVDEKFIILVNMQQILSQDQLNFFEKNYPEQDNDSNQEVAV